ETRLTTDSQQPTANSQQPTANSQQPTANSQQPTANSQQPTEHTDFSRKVKKILNKIQYLFGFFITLRRIVTRRDVS
ncbi:hypothetical protein J5690_10740, partial [bacterium]|nr:hypothetical protein [bacterium]